MKISGGMVRTLLYHIKGFMVGKAEQLKNLLALLAILQVLEGGEDPQRSQVWVQGRFKFQKNLCHHRIGLKRTILMILNYLTQRHLYRRYVLISANSHWSFTMLFSYICHYKQQVEKIFEATHPDPLELDKAKKMLKVRSLLYHR